MILEVNGDVFHIKVNEVCHIEVEFRKLHLSGSPKARQNLSISSSSKANWSEDDGESLHSPYNDACHNRVNVKSNHVGTYKEIDFSCLGIGNSNDVFFFFQNQ